MAPLITDELWSLLDEAIHTTHQQKSTSVPVLEELQQDVLTFVDEKERKAEARLTNKSIGRIDTKTPGNQISLFRKDSQTGVVRASIDSKESTPKNEPQLDNPSPRHLLQRALAPVQRKPQTTGSGWFNMPAVELTDELKRDLRVLQLRSVLDPKRFYKKDKSLLDQTKDQTARFLQIGTILDSPLEPTNRLTKRERKNRIVEELLADDQRRSYLKRKFTALQYDKKADRDRQRYKVSKSKSRKHRS